MATGGDRGVSKPNIMPKRLDGRKEQVGQRADERKMAKAIHDPLCAHPPPEDFLTVPEINERTLFGSSKCGKVQLE
jgi:hypothetical protein